MFLDEYVFSSKDLRFEIWNFVRVSSLIPEADVKSIYLIIFFFHSLDHKTAFLKMLKVVSCLIYSLLFFPRGYLGSKWHFYAMHIDGRYPNFFLVLPIVWDDDSLETNWHNIDLKINWLASHLLESAHFNLVLVALNESPIPVSSPISIVPYLP